MKTEEGMEFRSPLPLLRLFSGLKYGGWPLLWFLHRFCSKCLLQPEKGQLNGCLLDLPSLPKRRLEPFFESTGARCYYLILLLPFLALDVDLI